ncbi:Holliday junction resolvase RuvX [Pseudomonadales bacterium]|nr:Holliday junction resolvase RuvX [Pseudomonadales bacterium]
MSNENVNKKNKIILGFDFGLKQIGLAVGQTLTKTARPLIVIKAKDGKPQWQDIEAQIANWKPDYLVVGLPLNMDGTESDMSVRARKFANRLHGRFGCVVELCDERLSSAEAKSQLAEGREAFRHAASAEDIEQHGQAINRNNRDGTVDAIAAKLIVESWLSLL